MKKYPIGTVLAYPPQFCDDPEVTAYGKYMLVIKSTKKALTMISEKGMQYSFETFSLCQTQYELVLLGRVTLGKKYGVGTEGRRFINVSCENQTCSLRIRNTYKDPPSGSIRKCDHFFLKVCRLFFEFDPVSFTFFEDQFKFRSFHRNSLKSPV